MSIIYTDNVDIAQVAVDPAAAATRGKLYTKDVAGVTQLFYIASDGTVIQVTPAGSVLTWGNLSIAAAVDTRFLDAGYDDTTASTTIREYAIPRAGTLRNLFIRQNLAPGGTNANLVVYTVRINGVNTALTVSRAANAGIGQSSNIVTTVAVVQGDRIALPASKAVNIGSGAFRPIVSVELV